MHVLIHYYAAKYCKLQSTSSIFSEAPAMLHVTGADFSVMVWQGKIWKKFEY